MTDKVPRTGLRPAMLALGLASLGGLLAFGGGGIVHGERGSPAGTPCLEDSFEENDTQETAAAVALPFDQDALRVCRDDSDWFSFVLAAGDNVQIEASFGNALGDVDIAVYNQRGDLVGISDTPEDLEKITYAAPASGTYAVEVYLFRNPPVAGNSYALRIALVAATPTPTRTSTPTLTPPVSATPTPTRTSTPTLTTPVSATPTPMRTSTPTLTTPVSATPTPMRTSTPTLTPPVSATPTPTVPAGLLGDVNCDSLINSIDASLVLQFVARLVPTLLCRGTADVNLDSRVDSRDAALILQLLAGLIANLPP